MQSVKVQIDEYGKIRITDTDGNRMISLFRHIRNALAHGNTYFFENGFMMLADRNEKKDDTARIILPISALLEWIWIIDKNERYYVKSDYDVKEGHNK